ncbi:hypothetical protein [Candidatus Nitrotoga arctica]|uniref:Uncharacterized protein n=1 Tax=Candidatus Nitrotoga arctica TaxID=453162 RepID=A0ABM8Z131_9PROT|nr:hypothetical protein [Candidatus Nitrotoga arctica]CAG9933513.1 protein of unknown function [Candidatus Nitrotoga arctica]
MSEAYGLMQKAENHLMVSDDTAQPQRGNDWIIFAQSVFISDERNCKG